ncbi:diguanylate cyclase domain-containing protein [Crenobacter cavernae]|uniref:diguanylate cyclase domain-containing protein n=1 Tax=Crenobacter cavernae TaxID=2290923 RepID=UPI003D334176
MARRTRGDAAGAARARRRADRETASFGVAAFPEHGKEESQVLEKADLALYEAKRLGRNRVCRYGEPAGEHA